jgi:Ala-tRNA(Pro) deacylase
MIADKLRRYLDTHHVRYHVHEHEPRFTAQETAQVSHVSGKSFAKTVLLELAGAPPRYALAVLPANESVDLDRLGREIGQPVEIAAESAYTDVFPGYDVGAAPPLAALAKVPVPVYVDACLARGLAIAFNAGTHDAIVELPWKEYERLTSPRVLDYGRQ